MKKITFAIIALSLCIACQAQKNDPEVTPLDVRYDFDNMDGWQFGHQDNNPENQCEITDGILKIWTREGSVDRKKVLTKDKVFTTGRYVWRTFVSSMGMNDRSSVGSWIYSDDHHEIDFEVGSGTAQARAELGAQPDDLIAYMTTQDHPYQSTGVLVKSGWHIFEIDLSLKNGNYFVQWIIDGKVESSVQQTYGDQVKFHLFCSVENLNFLGDHPTTQESYGLFDYVTYTFHK